MRFIFKLRYHTNAGQSLWLTGNHSLLGDGDENKAMPLQYADGEFWQATVEFPQTSSGKTEISYHYILRNSDGSRIHDWGQDRTMDLSERQVSEVLIIDSWNDIGYVENTFYTEPFKEVLLRENRTEISTSALARVTHTFRVKTPLLPRGQTLCVLGNGAALANWNTAAPVLLSRRDGDDFFTAEFDLSNASLPVEYKYGVYDTEGRAFVRFEDGANRILRDRSASNGQVIVNDGFARLPLVHWRGAGIAIPVFSLRSESSFGVGEFSDLKLLVDWCKRTGLKLVQILPINDTTATHTWADSYPYSSISAFALHPIYLNLGEIANARNKKLLDKAEPERQRLNAVETLDYEAVHKAKTNLLKELYASQGTQTLKGKVYQKFFNENQDWLVPYAVFCHLRDEFNTSDTNQWSKLSRYNANEIAALAAADSPAYESIAFNYFLQFHLHQQLKAAVDYAHSQGVILKGDIPIGVTRYGVDAWQHEDLFNLDMQAGAPPDAFTSKGQNWGFPTYRWQRMKEDGFEWWKQRFKQMSAYFDAFRIDHILGFFRIWSVPIDSMDGLMGYFVRALPVRAAEFPARGIAFDRERFTQPFINDAVLSELLGDDASLAKEQFLEPSSPGRWRFKKEFATQRQLEAHFAKQEKSKRNEKLKDGLFELFGNVILFVDRKEPDDFHFRFAVDQTSSFKNLDAHTRDKVWELYVDYFFRRQDAFWKNEAMEKLPALKRSTNMLVCGEDLGLVPACVPEVMQHLGLLSLEIQRMPKDSRQEFFRPAAAPYLSVVTPSTHDMSTVREWWEEDRKVTQKFFNSELNTPDVAPVSCEPWISRAVIEQHLASPAMWSIFQLQDLLGMDEQLRRKNPADERINVPANPRHYWRYRMHLKLELLLGAGTFNDDLKHLISQHDR